MGLNGMSVEEIEELGKKIHQLAEEFETACKMADGFQAYFTIGALYSLMPSLKAMGRRCHEMNRTDIPEDVVYGSVRLDDDRGQFARRVSGLGT